LPGIIGATCLILFFGARVVVGLAGWTDILLVILGVALILIEAFLLPGVGLAGGLGVVLFLLGIYLTSTRVPIPQYHWDFARIRDLAYTLTFSLSGFLLLAYLTTRLLPRTPFYQRLVLSNEMRADAGYVVQTEQDEASVGLEGVALTDLRPAGRGRFEGRSRSVVSRGEYVDRGTPIRVIRVEGNRYVVDPIQE
jgi:membrane-bound serine protease (ClpP class)